MVKISSFFGPSTPLKKSKILPFPYVFYPPIFGSYESPLKTGSGEPCLIRIKWLKSQVILVKVLFQKSQILPVLYVFHPPMFGSYESPIKTGSDDPCLIRIKWLKSQVFLVQVRPSKKVKFCHFLTFFTPLYLVHMKAL